MLTRRALITGITGQDGSYLASELLSEGYKVYGSSGSHKKSDLWRFSKLGIIDNPDLVLIDWDITNAQETNNILEDLKPNELFNLASHSFVPDSSRSTSNTLLVSSFAPVNLMEAINSFSPETRFFQAGSSEMFGSSAFAPQKESSAYSPRNVYGAAKLLAQFAVENFRNQYQMFTSSGVLYNHESPLRGSEFVTKKITSTVAKIKLGQESELRIGNLSSVRDWGYAPEYVKAMRLVIGHSAPETFVIASGAPTKVRDFVKWAFQSVEIEISFEGVGLSEIGYETTSGKVLVSVDKEFFRESETVTLVGDPSKAAKLLGWQSTTSVEDLVEIMVNDDLESILSRTKNDT